MKLMVASDIHGSSFFCEKLIEAFKKENPDKLLLLGDLLYHGPRNDLPQGYAPKKVIEMLNSIKHDLICIKGNCESEVDQMVLQFPIMAEYAYIYIEGLTIYATHGHKYNNDNLPMISEGDILLCGHTHIPAFNKEEKYIYINPGSVSIPKENSKNSYIIIEDNICKFKDIEGNEYSKFNILY